MDSRIPSTLPNGRRRILITMFFIFLSALGVRLLVWQGNRPDIEAVMTGLTAGYKDDARTLLSGNFSLFLRGPAPPSDANVMAHPPGYSILMAFLYKLFGEKDAALRFFQILCDALSVLLVFLIALELAASKTVALIASLLAAISPQLAYNSLLLLPDSVSILPILLAVYVLARAKSKPHDWPNLILAGALLGVSCWLRPNALLLPFYLAALLFFTVPRSGPRWRAPLVLLASFVLVIAPVTIRNMVVFKTFIPLSLGSGVTFIEGIADYDKDGWTRLPRTDMEVLRREAEMYGRADYAGSLYNPDGIERERARVREGLNAVRSRPVWFAGVMLRRAASMLRMERVPVIAGSPLASSAGVETKRLSPPGIILKSIQKLFVTALMLPLCLIGIFLLARKKEWHALALLLIVPVYYLSVQSMLHTEYRYVIAIQYFLHIFVAFTIYSVSCALWRRKSHAKARRREGGR